MGEAKPRPPRSRFPSGDDRFWVEITDDGSRTLVRTDSGVSFHSGSGAATETRHVYLHNSGVSERLRSGAPTRVLEVGLGSGMALLMTLGLAARHAAPLEYVAIDHCWPTASALEQLRPATWVADPELAASFLQWRRSLGDDPAEGRHFWSPAARLRVTVALCDARSWVAGEPQPFDAIYFDPFVPQDSPELWECGLLLRLRRALADGGRLVTYCVSRQARQRFGDAGFRIRRVPGPPGGKREVLVAEPDRARGSC